MSTPSAKTPTSAAAGKTAKTTTTTVVKTTTTTTIAKQPQQTLISKRGIGSKLKKPKTTATGKKVVNSHSNRLLNNNGLMRFSRGRMFHRRALYRINQWKDAQSKLQGDKTKKTAGSIQKKKQRKPALVKKPVGGERNGKERLVRSKRFVCCKDFYFMFLVEKDYFAFSFSHVIIQLKNDQRNFLLNVKILVVIHVVFDQHLHLVLLLFLLLVNKLEK